MAEMSLWRWAWWVGWTRGEGFEGWSGLNGILVMERIDWMEGWKSGGDEEGCSMGGEDGMMDWGWE